MARVPISTFRYESRQEPRTTLGMREIAQTRVRCGHLKISVLLNREGWQVGKMLEYRLHREKGLRLRHKPQRSQRAAIQRQRVFPAHGSQPGVGTGFCDTPVGENGAEFTSQRMDLWAYHNHVQIDFSRPGRPTNNAYVESFNGTLRAECLDVHWFATLTRGQAGHRGLETRI
jgi:putative transposase